MDSGPTQVSLCVGWDAGSEQEFYGLMFQHHGKQFTSHHFLVHKVHRNKDLTPCLNLNR